MRDGRFVAVGGNREVTSLVGPRTRVIDLRGRTVTPGLRRFARPPGLVGRRQAALRPHGLAAGSTSTWSGSRPTPRPTRTSRGSWAAGWYLAHFPDGLARREDLDRVVPDRPVFLPNKDGHDAWVNSRALELAGHHRRHARPPRRAHRPRPGRHAAGHAPRGRAGPGGAPHPADDGRGARAGAPREPGLPPRHRDHELAGRDRRRPRSTRRTARSPAAARSRRGSPGRCGGSTTAGSTRSRASSPDAPKAPWAGMP